MLGPDAVEKPQYLLTGPVKPTQQSDRDKKQKFKDALKEKLEEDQDGKHKKSPEDELVLADEPKDEFEAETETEAEDEQRTEQETQPETEDEGTGEPEQEDKDQTGSPEAKHIDVKA